MLAERKGKGGKGEWETGKGESKGKGWTEMVKLWLHVGQLLAQFQLERQNVRS